MNALLTVPADKRKLAYACARALASLDLNTKPHELSATKHALRVALDPYPKLLAEVDGDVTLTEVTLDQTAKAIDALVPARDPQLIRRIMTGTATL